MAALAPSLTPPPYRHLPHVAVTKDMASLLTRSAPVRLNRAKLGRLGYGKAALDSLEAGYSISYSEDDTPADCSIREFPNGRRYLQRGEWLADQKAWRVETIRQIADAPR